MINILFGTVALLMSSIYSQHFTDIDGNKVNMRSFEGKKILLVNIATGNSRVNQLPGLQQLHEQYGNKLVIIAFPSNSFGKEARSNKDIKEFCQSYGVTFRVAEKTNVSGNGVHGIYNWLAKASENGAMDATVGADFQKYLISETGNIIGVFSPSTPPNDKALVDAIREN